MFFIKLLKIENTVQSAQAVTVPHSRPVGHLVPGRRKNK